MNQPDLRDYKLDWRPRPADIREWRYAMPITAADRSKNRSLAKYFGPVDDQGSEGSCVANSSAIVQEACAAITGMALPVPEVSREEIYYLGRVAEGTFPQDTGMYTADGFDVVLKQQGCHLESDWPYDANPSEKPPTSLSSKPKALYISGHSPISASSYIDGILNALDATQPLVLALQWANQFFSDYQNTGVLSNTTAQIVGGHQIAIKGWTTAQGGLVWCQNSWGLTSPARTDLHPDARQGDVFLPLSLFTNGIVMEVRAAIGTGAPTPTPTPTPTPVPVVTISGPQSLAVGQTGSFLVASTGAKSPIYRVDYGDGAFDPWSAVSSHTHAYANAGTYTLTALCFDSSTSQMSQPAKMSCSVSVAPAPTPTPTDDPPVGVVVTTKSGKTFSFR